MQADQDVVERGHRGEQPDVLEGPADTEGGHLVRLERLRLAAGAPHDRFPSKVIVPSVGT